MGCDCSLVTLTIGELSRSCHGEGHVRQSWFRIGYGGSRGVWESCTRARSDRGTRETRLPSFVSKDRSYKPMVKSSGGQRESEGVVLVMIGVELKASGAKDPDFGHGCVGGKRWGMVGAGRSSNPGGLSPVDPGVDGGARELQRKL